MYRLFLLSLLFPWFRFLLTWWSISRSLQGMSSKHLKPDFPQVLQRMPASGRYPKNSPPVPWKPLAYAFSSHTSALHAKFFVHNMETSKGCWNPGVPPIYHCVAPDCLITSFWILLAHELTDLSCRVTATAMLGCKFGLSSHPVSTGTSWLNVVSCFPP